MRYEGATWAVVNLQTGSLAFLFSAQAEPVPSAAPRYGLLSRQRPPPGLLAGLRQLPRDFHDMFEMRLVACHLKRGCRSWHELRWSDLGASRVRPSRYGLRSLLQETEPPQILAVKEEEHRPSATDM